MDLHETLRRLDMDEYCGVDRVISPDEIGAVPEEAKVLFRYWVEN